MPKRYRVRPLLTQAHYIAIGRAIATWAALEIVLDKHLLEMLEHEKARHLLKVSDVEVADGIPVSLKRRLALFDRLARIHYSDEILGSFLSVSDRCRELAKTRHELAHGEWIIVKLPIKPFNPVLRTRRAGVPGDAKPFPVPKIRQMTHEVCDLYLELLELSIAHHPHGPLEEQLKTWSRRQPSKTTS